MLPCVLPEELLLVGFDHTFDVKIDFHVSISKLMGDLYGQLIQGEGNKMDGKPSIEQSRHVRRFVNMIIAEVLGAVYFLKRTDAKPTPFTFMEHDSNPETARREFVVFAREFERWMRVLCHERLRKAFCIPETRLRHEFEKFAGKDGKLNRGELLGIMVRMWGFLKLWIPIRKEGGCKVER